MNCMMKESIQRVRFFFRTLTSRRLDVLDWLEKDHIRIEMLFLRWRFTKVNGRSLIFESIKKELQSHSDLEETLFYPACEKILELKDLITESYEEHNQYKVLM